MLVSRAAYEAEFTAWEAAGFRVLECRSREPRVQLAGDVAIFTHRVSTLASTGGVETRTDERETIVFRRQADGGWIAIHEHLSPTPEDQDA